MSAKDVAGTIERYPFPTHDTTPTPRPVLLIAEEGSLSDLPEGVEVIWIKPGKTMPLVVSR